MPKRLTLSGLFLILLLTPMAHADRIDSAARALDALVAHADGTKPLSEQEVLAAGHTIRDVVRGLPPGDTRLLPRLANLRTKHAADLAPTPKRPLRKANVLGRLLMTLDLDRLGRLPATQVKAHPAAAAFPGAVPANAPRVSQTVTIDTATPGWHSTGLYAAPGQIVTVTVPASAAGKGLYVRIGCHKDGLWRLDAWRRPPAICHHFALAGATTQAASAFGGPVYVEVPRDCGLGSIKAVIAGAIEMPYYVHGQTDLAAWRKTIRGRPAPWAELASEKIVLTLPATVVRTLDDPKAVMDFWDAVADACADLAARPRDRERPERYVADVQISAGYMHSGYPIMTLLDMPAVMVDLKRLKTNAHGGVWGLFHELGHNHQVRDWTFRGTVEVTVNLFTMYVMETVCGLAPTRCHGSISDRTRARKTRDYLAAPDFTTWQRDPFLGLIMYIQMQQAFGWEPFKKVFAEYRTLEPAERPKTEDARRDQWMVRFSLAVGKDLGPFFAAWHIPVSDTARKAIADLPDWMPEGFPPDK